jgi:1-deoxy-D-xylulose-5-phosphate reductoisomerase
MKRVAVLGATGSIGTQTLDVISQFPDDLQVVGVASRRDVEGLRRLAHQSGAERLATYDSIDSDIPSGMDAIIDLATSDEVDIVVVSVAGVIGLLPTLAAIQAGKQIALASKEVLVAAGEIVMPMIAKHQTVMTPIDSEHSALFQCLQGYRSDQIDKLILTASGGPFRGKARADLVNVTAEQALNHPTWRMGGKITVDSATLMNKGLEMIEAKWLFGVDIDQVEVVVHPQSIVHSFVRFRDGSVLGQLGWPDMRLPIAYALLYPERKCNNLKPWEPTETPSLTFETPDESTFHSLSLARESSKIGGTMPCAMNAANEEAANAFLRGEVSFLEIPEIVDRCMQAHSPKTAGLSSILETDAQTRAFVRKLIEKA